MALDITQSALASQTVDPPLTHQQAATSGRSVNTFWHELIAHAAAEAGIDPVLAVGVAAQESGLDPNALNHSSGALGIMQLMPSTAAALGVNPRDAMENITGGIRYLREQIQNFGDKAKALAAYNWGPRHVAEAVERWGTDWLRHAPSETQHYVACILSKTGNNDAPGSIANALPASSPSSSESIPASSAPHHLDPALLAEALKLRSAMNAYLLSEILD